MEYNFERSLDELGRVVLPVDGRRALALQESDILSVQVDPQQQTLILKKQTPSCLICRGTENLRPLPNRTWLCKACINNLNK